MLTIIRGRTASEMTRDQLDAMSGPYGDVTVDLGAGDGLFALRYAREHPQRFVIAIEPVRENVREESAKAAKKPERGGAPNALYVCASIEMLPDELRGIAGEILVTLPWGSLMRGIILGEETVLHAIASLGREGAAVRIVLNTRIFDEPVPLEARDLPELSPEYARETLAPAFERAGMRIDESRWMEAEEVASLGTTWAKRLSHRSPPRSLMILATVAHDRGT